MATEEDIPASDAMDAREWALVQCFDEEGRPLMVRVKQYEEAFVRADYPHRVHVFWPVSDDAENGLPTPSDVEAMNRFENHLCAAVEPDGQSTLAVVVTGAGEREWVLQSRDPKVFLERISGMPHEGGSYPIELAHELDEDWAVVDAYRPEDDADGAPSGVTIH